MPSNLATLSSPLLSQEWLYQLYRRLGEGKGPLPIQGYAKASMPLASDWGDTASFTSLIYVTDEVGGPVLAFSDGTNWRRVTDRAVVA